MSFDRYVHPIRVGVVDITVMDADPMYHQLINEIPAAYDFEGIHFQEGDVMLDIGAHVGLTSIYYGKLFPGLRIYAYEPVPFNFARLKEHIELNGTANVHAHQLAVTGDGKPRDLVSTDWGSVGYTAFHDSPEGRETHRVRSTTVPKILARYGIKRVKMMKLDCEGAEYEILGSSAKWLHRVDAIRGEIHSLVQRHSEYDPVEIAKAVPDVRWMFV